MRHRKATACQACGYPSYAGRVCRECKKYYGSAEDALTSRAMRQRMRDAEREKGFDGVMKVLGSLCDVIVPDWPGVSLPRLLWSAPPIRPADQEPGGEPGSI